MLSKLEQRIVDISYKNNLSHIGSCLGAVNMIDNIYQVKKPEDKFVLGVGHAALALYVVLEKNGFGNAEDLFDKHGVHPNRDLEDKIDVSTGSLGQALPIAVGMALANRERDVYVVSSDGEMGEGSNWEALRVASEQKLENLKVAVLANGYSGYGEVDVDWLDTRLNSFYPCLVIRTNMFKYPEFLQGLAAHYKTLNENEYQEVIKS